MITLPSKASTACLPALLWLTVFSLFCLMTYGGIRTPDEEVTFRVGQSLAMHGTFAVEKDLEAWPEFGLPRGLDGRRYSGFGPIQPILLAPFIRAAANFNQSQWYEFRRIPVSFAVDAEALRSYILNQRPVDMEPHALRFLVSFFSPLVASLAVVLQFWVVRRLTGNPAAAFITALLLGLATPLWDYSGTMFREPLAMVFSTASFFMLIPSHGESAVMRNSTRVFGAGFLSGLACATHITAILSVPFFLMLAVYPCSRREKREGEHGGLCINAVVMFLAGAFIVAALWGWHNQLRFGSFWETGRKVPSPIIYGVFTAPWEGLIGLLASPGKGLFWFCPILAAAIFCWPGFHKRHRYLSSIIIAMALFRLFFIACRSDWHGGFCLGPRYFLMLLPFLLIPVGCRLADFWTAGRPISVWRPVAAGGYLFACVVQQIYFCLGEPISFYYMLKIVNLQQGVSIITNNQIYFQWSASPLFHLFDGRRGPFFLQSVPLDQWTLLVACSLGVALITGLLVFCLIRVNGKLYK
ncbi:MAG: phospholipid carrier-dependent glycosyltransferase [Thermodesulfobacteriota bacterium]